MNELNEWPEECSRWSSDVGSFAAVANCRGCRHKENKISGKRQNFIVFNVKSELEESDRVALSALSVCSKTKKEFLENSRTVGTLIGHRCRP